MATEAWTTKATSDLLLNLVKLARAPRVRTMREFAEQEIIIPDGPFKGRRFRCDRQPYTYLWFDEIDSGNWSRFVATGPSQSGKTLCAYVIPALYHLFEIKETIIAGLPSMNMAADKWREDILPAIQQSRYRDLLPTSGDGSRGGQVEAVQFRNGATLRFMSGGGGDKQRAGFTSRVLLLTEVDGMDEAGGNSREADKISQLEARTRAYGGRARTYMECTVSVKQGRTWHEYTHGSASKIVVRCRHCMEWVTPERENLTGWRDAATVVDARDGAAFACPACGLIWSEDDRAAANAGAKLVHAGQSISTTGTITGEPPRTRTLGFRWNAANNQFVSAADLAEDEWNAARDPNPDNAEKRLRQFVWALPHEPEEVDLSAIDMPSITKRTAQPARGIVPRDSIALTVGTDLGKRLFHWVAIAWRDQATPHIVDYGRIEVPTDDIGETRAIGVALGDMRDMCEAGWPVDGGECSRQPDQVWIDTGWHGEHGPRVYEITAGWGSRYRPAKGYGATQEKYMRPKVTSNTVRLIGDDYHASLLPQGNWLIHVNCDQWKSFLHDAAKVPVEKPGALTLFDAPPNEHITYAKHLTSEKKVEEFVAGKGLVIRWHAENRNNHYLDASMLAAAAGHMAGVRRLPSAPKPQASRHTTPIRITKPDGRPFITVR